MDPMERMLRRVMRGEMSSNNLKIFEVMGAQAERIHNRVQLLLCVHCATLTLDKTERARFFSHQETALGVLFAG